MKRFIGLLLVGAGGIATIWGGYHVVLGESGTRLALVDGFSVTALTTGLVGVAAATVGLLWVRD